MPTHTHIHPGTDPVTHTHEHPISGSDCHAARPHTHADGIHHSHPHADGCAHADRLPKHRPLPDPHDDDDPTADTAY